MSSEYIIRLLIEIESHKFPYSIPGIIHCPVFWCHALGSKSTAEVAGLFPIDGGDTSLATFTFAEPVANIVQVPNCVSLLWHIVYYCFTSR